MADLSIHSALNPNDHANTSTKILQNPNHLNRQEKQKIKSSDLSTCLDLKDFFELMKSNRGFFSQANHLFSNKRLTASSNLSSPHLSPQKKKLKVIVLG